MSTLLVVVSKVPRLGVGKQRLAAQIGAQHAYEVAQRLFACTLEDAKTFPHVLFYLDQQPEHLSGLEVVLQHQGNLGERINHLDERLRKQAFEKIVYIGSDCPLLTHHDYEQVMTQLDSHDAVLKPSQDGGVTLMASRLRWPDLSKLAWSTELLCQELVQCLTQSGYSQIYMLEENYDIDTQQDLLQLLQDLQDDQRDSRQQLVQWVSQATHKGVL